MSDIVKERDPDSLDKWQGIPSLEDVGISEKKKQILGKLLENKGEDVRKQDFLDTIPGLTEIYLRSNISEFNKTIFIDTPFKIESIKDENNKVLAYRLDVEGASKTDELDLSPDTTSTSDGVSDIAIETLNEKQIHVILDCDKRCLTIGEKSFTPEKSKQFEFLLYLLENNGAVRTREELNSEIEVGTELSFQGMANVMNARLAYYFSEEKLQIVFEPHQNIQGEEDYSDRNKDVFSVVARSPLKVDFLIDGETEE